MQNIGGTSSMAISAHQQKDIQDFCLNEPRTIQQIASKLLLKGKSAIMQLYNFFKTQAAKTLFYIENSDGIKYIRTNPLFFINEKLDLIFTKQNYYQTKINNGKQYKKLDSLKKAGPERTEAALKLNRINKFGYYNKETKQFEYENTVRQEIDELYQAYGNRISKEQIVLTRAPDNNPTFAQDLIIPYKTRFTDPGRRKESLARFSSVYTSASRRHLKGVFLTLTADPKGGSLWEINKKTQAAWGPFSRFLGRCLPKRAEWIKVAEFQKSGRLHYHVLITGINWLLCKSVIQYAWVHYGGGPILDVHTVKADPLNGWLWSRSCPIEAAGKTVGDHLQSYLEKSMSQQHGSMYWATGVRSWTCSGSLSETLRKDKPLRSPKKRFFLKGVLSALTGFRSSHRKDSISLFAVKTAQEKPNKPKKEKPSEPEKLSLSFTTASKITQSYLKASRGL